jgi:iron complex outermembrane receptor protein
MQKHLPVILFFIASAKLWAQQSSSRQDSIEHALPSVTISAFGKRQIEGHSISDSLHVTAPMNSSLSRSLGASGRLYLREYTPGGIGSVSIRGGNAAQTAVLWDGLNIQNNMLGQTDPSLVASELFSSVILEPQSSSSGWGSGPVAGAIHLLQNDTGKWLRAQALYNSFGGTRHAVNHQFSGSRFRQRVGIVYENSANRYPFRNSNGSIEKAGNAALHGAHAVYNVDIPLAGHKFYLRTWGAKVYREIPPTLDMLSSDATQTDAFLRVQTGIKKYNQRFGYDIRFAGFYENIRYRDTLSGIISDGTSRIFHADAEVHYLLSEKLFFLAGGGYQYLNADISEYRGKPRLHRVQSYMQARWQATGAVRIQPSYRTEWISAYRLIHLPQLDIHVSLLPHLSSRFSAGKTFRYPSFNDFFWIQGGNPNLLPEHGLQAEAALQYDQQWGPISVQSSYSIFYRSVKNWIQWAPVGNLWQAMNLNMVNLRGSEWSAAMQGRRGMWKAGLSTNISYTLAENPEISRESGHYSQLIYVPMYQGMAALHLGYGRWSIFWQQQYFGYRYTSNDNYQYLPPFMLSHAGCGYQKTNAWHISARINNLFNQNYQTIARRPMPLRWFELSLQLQLNK